MTQNNLKTKVVQIRHAANAIKELAEKIGKIGDLSIVTESMMNDARDKLEATERSLRCLYLADQYSEKNV